MKKFSLLFLLPLFLCLSGCGGGDGLHWKGLDVTDLEGKAVSMEQFGGERLFLNFWATWCRPCLAEMPDMEQLRKSIESEGYKFVLVSDEPIETIEAYTSKKNYGFTYLKLNTSIKSLGMFSIPQTYIIDRQGNVVKHIAEYSDWNTPEKLEMLQAIP